MVSSQAARVVAAVTTRRHIGVDPLAVSIDEAADLLSISRAKVYELIDRGEFAPTVHFGKSVVVPLAELRAWLASRIAEEQQQREDERQRLTPVKIQPTPPVAARNGSK